MKHYVYKITNILNGKIYIGKRSFNGNVEEDRYMGSNKKLKEDMKECGTRNFIKEILEILNSEEEAFEKEDFYITKYMRCKVKMYNIRNGAHGGRSRGAKEKKAVPIRINADTLSKIRDIAEENERSIHYIVNEALEKYIVELLKNNKR